MIKRVYGAAGAGKSTLLLNTIMQALKDGIKPDEIGFISFSKVAVTTMINRIQTKFRYTRRQFPYFRTLHSLAFYVTGATRSSMMTTKALKDFGKQAGYEFNGRFDNAGSYLGPSYDDYLMNMYMVGREFQLGQDGIYDQSALNVARRTYDTMVRSYKAYKEHHWYVDFHDLIEGALEAPVLPSLKLLLLDEAQDFSPIQWKLVDRLVAQSEDTYIAGDDLQAIYTWRGAEVERFIKYPVNENIILKQSYRVPRAIQKFAEIHAAEKIVNKLTRTVLPRDEEGAVSVIEKIDEVDFEKYNSYLLLTRNGHYCNFFRKEMIELGIPATMNGENIFTQAQKQEIECLLCGDITEVMLDNYGPMYRYFKRIEANGMKQDILEPKVRIDTIHKVKGDEAECVVLYTPMSTASYDDCLADPDAFYRLLYVALTRAKKELFILDDPTKECRFLKELKEKC